MLVEVWLLKYVCFDVLCVLFLLLFCNVVLIVFL